MQNKELVAIIVITALLALLLVGFIITIIFLYAKRQEAHKIEMAKLQDEYDKQIMRVQFEMREATLTEIASKLHDDLKNNIHTVGLILGGIVIRVEKETIEKKELIAILNQVINDTQIVRDEIRSTSHSLSQDKLQNIGLIDAIAAELSRISRSIPQLNVITNINRNISPKLSQEQIVYIYRIFQEVVGNVITHSKATQMITTIDIVKNNTFLLMIEDDGVGFNVSEKKKNKLSGIGLPGIQKRAIQIGGNLTINSKIENGTIIKFELPLLATS